MKSIKILALLLCAGFFLQSCEKENLSPDLGMRNQGKGSVNVSGGSNSEPGDPLCPTGGCTTSILCDIECTYGGFNIQVTQGDAGPIKYTLQVRNTIYVDQTYHNANYPYSGTSNPYTFDSFIILNTINHPSMPWKDVNGNVIVGNVYQYRLKNPQCLSTFTTEWLHGVPNPCDINSALLHLNQSQNKPQTACPNTIICPAPPIVSIPYVDHKPQKLKPTFIYYFGKQCKTTNPGYCGPVQPPFSWDDIYSPHIGPIQFTYLEEEESFQLNFLRDMKEPELVIDASETEIPQAIIEYYNLEQGIQLKTGTYPIVPNDYDHGSAVVGIVY